jgi:hypothetical protein
MDRNYPMNHDVIDNRHFNRVDEDAEQAFTSEGGYVARQTEAASVRSESSERARLMSEFSIQYDGRHYRYCGYRYDRLEDAVDYARLMRARHSPVDDVQSFVSDGKVEIPDASDRQVMARLSISFKTGVYEFEGFHYDRLADAVSYAQLRRHIEANETGTD